MWSIFQNHFTKTSVVGLLSSDGISSTQRHSLATSVNWNYGNISFFDQIPMWSHNEWVASLSRTEVTNSFYYSEIGFKPTEIKLSSMFHYTHTKYTYTYTHSPSLGMSHM